MELAHKKVCGNNGFLTMQIYFVYGIAIGECGLWKSNK